MTEGKYEKEQEKRISAWCCSILAVFLLVTLAGGWYLFGEDIKAANSITKLEDGLYSMEYQGDYGFDEFLKRGGAKSDSDVAVFLASYLSHGFYRMDPQIIYYEIIKTRHIGTDQFAFLYGNGRIFAAGISRI